ncbi:uncharacterized protein BKA78DRAFT_88326 [Phyllosticta capitalensis]|uniref:uncharacterized protein n=1 Tax=Phyllosticta capitalensis TaxID=121624 RepID=UPI00312CFFDC
MLGAIVRGTQTKPLGLGNRISSISVDTAWLVVPILFQVDVSSTACTANFGAKPQTPRQIESKSSQKPSPSASPLLSAERVVLQQLADRQGRRSSIPEGVESSKRPEAAEEKEGQSSHLVRVCFESFELVCRLTSMKFNRGNAKAWFGRSIVENLLALVGNRHNMFFIWLQQWRRASLAHRLVQAHGTDPCSE